MKDLLIHLFFPFRISSYSPCVYYPKPYCHSLHSSLFKFQAETYLYIYVVYHVYPSSPPFPLPLPCCRTINHVASCPISDICCSRYSFRMPSSTSPRSMPRKHRSHCRCMRIYRLPMSLPEMERCPNVRLLPPHCTTKLNLLQMFRRLP
jgi:hypothetical protein